MACHQISAFIFCLVSTVAAAQVTVNDGSNADPNPGAGPAGPRPYEMVGRSEARTPLVTFEDATQWRVEARDAVGFVYRTQERRLFRDHCGKLTYRATAPRAVIEVKLKMPVDIPDPWDSINFWNHGNNFTGNTPGGPVPESRVTFLIDDADGKRHDVEVEDPFINYPYWHLMHARVLVPIKAPARFVGVRIRENGAVPPQHTRPPLYLGPIYFYKDELKPLSFDPPPARLPFPTREDTILPTNKTASFNNTVHHTTEQTVFTYEGDDCTLAFRYRPKTGSLGDIAVLHGGREVYPCKGGGIQIGGVGPDTQAWAGPYRAELVSQHMDGDVLSVKWQLFVHGRSAQSWLIDRTHVTYRLKMKQKSLIVEMQEHRRDAGAVEQVLLGRAEPVEDAKLFWVPYLTFGSSAIDPRVLYADGLFYFTQFDWYYSDASKLFAHFGIDGDQARFNGGAGYTPKTDGRRNPMRERLFINVSPDFQEVLPTIPNPPSPMKDVQGDRVWDYNGGADHERELREARRLRALGLEKVSIHYHEATWRDGWESYTYKTEAAPKGGDGDEKLRRFLAANRALGWRAGVYSSYCDFSPINKHWHEDLPTRSPTGDWKTGHVRCYAPKPWIAVQLQAKLAPIIHEKFATNFSYCDVHTIISPWARVDFDARAPGAAKFRTVFECYGRLLYNEKFAHEGPVYSEGLNHWWYAGLTDGNYAQLSSGRPAEEPMLVDFDLLKMHPLQIDAGMGEYGGMFCRGSGLNRLDSNYQRFVAMTLGYGHIAFLKGARGEPDMTKIYYMLQPLQEHYTMIPVRRIGYERDGELLDTSKALISGAYRDSRLHVAYESGFKVWVNGSTTGWNVQAAGRDWDLLPWGYLGITADGETFSFSGHCPVDGLWGGSGSPKHIDLSHGPVSHYLDTRGAFVVADTIAGQGRAALKRENTGWELIPTMQFTEFGFRPDLIGLDGSDIGIQAIDEEGNQVAAPTVRWSRGMFFVMRDDENTFKYLLRKAAGTPPPPVQCETRLAVPGGVVRAMLPPQTDVDADRITWLVGDCEHIATATVDGQSLAVQVPSDVSESEHVWMRISTTDGDLWLDFVGAAP